MKYYLAFFLNYRPFLQEKIKLFVNDGVLSLWLNYNCKDVTFTSKSNLPEEIYPPKQWYLYGCSLNNIVNEKIPEIPLCKGTSLGKVDRLFNAISSNYSWTIFPWGSIYSDDLLSSFLFISKNQKIFDRFMKSYSNNIIDIESHHGHIIPQCNLLISHYQIKTDFSEIAQAILIEEDFDYPGSLIWDACKLDSSPPLLISEVYCSEETNNFYEIEDSDPDSPIYWERANYKPLKIIDVYIKEKNSNLYPNNNKKFGLYQPQDKQSFIDICKSLYQGTQTLIFVPYNTNIDNLTILLSKIEASDYSKYSDLSYIQDILQATKWFYGLNRNNVDVGDNMYSLFASTNKELIQKIDSLNPYYNSKLISFF